MIYDVLQWLGSAFVLIRMETWATVAAHFGVPLVMVSGDVAACVEVRQFIQPVECAVVTRGVGRNRAELVELQEARHRIRNAACNAIKLLGEAKPFTPILPMEIKLELYRSDYCDWYSGIAGVERFDARSARKVVNSYLDVVF